MRTHSLIAALAVGLACATTMPTSSQPPVCHSRFEDMPPCSGATYAEGEAPTQRVEICDRCRDDGDCDARRGGRCELFRGDTCSPARRLCVYPGQDCYRPDDCEATADEWRTCFHRDDAVVCAAPEPPPE